MITLYSNHDLAISLAGGQQRSPYVPWFCPVLNMSLLAHVSPPWAAHVMAAIGAYMVVVIGLV